MKTSSMEKNITFTLKLSKNVRDTLKAFCKSRGYMMKGFVEKAILDEIEKDEIKEDLLSIEHFEKFEKSGAKSYADFAKRIGLK